MTYRERGRDGGGGRGRGGYRQKDMEGVLFKNDDPQGENSPDYLGSMTVDGDQFWLSAWINEAQSDGRKYLSLKMRPKEGRRGDRSGGRGRRGEYPSNDREPPRDDPRDTEPQRGGEGPPDDDDDIPF